MTDPDLDAWGEFLSRPFGVVAMALLATGVVWYVLRRFYFPPKEEKKDD